MKKIIPAIVLACLACVMGFNMGERPADIEKRMASHSYKAEQAAHFAKLARMEAAR